MFWTGCTFSAVASWYGVPFHGRLTASGYIYNQEQLTCASNVHKFGTVLKVTNVDNNKSVIVVVTDTGSFDRKYNRHIDLSKKAFSKIENLNKGLANVRIEVVSTENTFRYKHNAPIFNYTDYVRRKSSVKQPVRFNIRNSIYLNNVFRIHWNDGFSFQNVLNRRDNE